MIKFDHSHNPEDIAARLSDGPKAHYLREWVYGGIDGVVTTFAVVAAVIGADLSAWIVLIMGLANLVGDGFSMAASSYSGAKAEGDNYKRLRKVEISHINKYPEGEREETRQLFAAKGFEGGELESMVDMISKDQDTWIEFMMNEEYGISRPINTPLQVGLHTFAAFVVCGCAPLLPFIFSLPHAEWLALIFSGVTFFFIGAIKSKWSIHPWWSEGLGTAAIGLTAAALAFAIGFALQDFIPY